MAEPRTGNNEEDLLVVRQATLRSLTYVCGQIAVLSEHVAGIQQQIRSLEEELVLLHRSHRKAA